MVVAPDGIQWADHTLNSSYGNISKLRQVLEG